MELNQYQNEAEKTDKTDFSGHEERDKRLVISLLGLVGEAGTLLTEYKKLLRDGESHVNFDERVAEELGDCLWYLAAIARNRGHNLNDIAEKNLAKTKARFINKRSDPLFFDEKYPEEQRLPRTFEYSFEYNPERRVILKNKKGEQVGDALSDNAWEADGYRFHDVFHLAMLGWSPVARKILGENPEGGGERKTLKRKADGRIDEVEDGARAAILEEAIVAMIYTYAADNKWLQDASRVDWELLKGIKRIIGDREVKVRTEAEWEQAILVGVCVFKQICDADGGTVVGDARNRTLEFKPKTAMLDEE